MLEVKDVISVIIPSFKRPAMLKNCVQALSRQIRVPDEVIVVARDTDQDTRLVLSELTQEFPFLREALVVAPGMIAAMNVGLVAVRGDIISFTDDDSEPKPDWLFRVSEHFRSDIKLGGLGGRDWLREDGRLVDGARRVVGRFTFFGHRLGHHHLGVGKVREVHFLKGVNMSFRRSAIAGEKVDDRLRGAGAQYHCDMSFSLGVLKRGWKLKYDPLVAVDHFPASTGDVGHRRPLSGKALEDYCFNESFAVTTQGSFWIWYSSTLWNLMIGSHVAPGLAQFLCRPWKFWGRLGTVFKGRWAGILQGLK